MCHVISQNYQTYETPRDIRVADRVYNGISSVDTRELVDNDGKTKVAKYLDGMKSRHVSLIENDKVVRSTEYYYRPRTMLFGGKYYSDIISKLTIPNKYDVYTIHSADGKTNSLRVRKNGAVQDVAEIQKLALRRKILNPLKSVAKSLMGMIL